MTASINNFVYNTTGFARPGRKRGFLGYRGLFSPNFINPCFRYSPIVNIKNLDFKKSDIFKHPSFTVNIENTVGCLKISDF